MHREIARLRDVTESLLTFSRTPRIDAAPHDVNVLVGHALEVLAEPIADGAVTVETELADGGAPLTVVCDGYKLQGVLINLIKNAIEAMSTRPLDLAGDGSTSTKGERRLTVTTRREGDRVAIEVRDTGPGVSNEARKHLYEPFFTTKVTGTGLGLATARRVVDAHGGSLESLEVESEGARFRVTIPVGEVAAVA
jgi:C4-dicarboxylate-specific signal transduction histidine kinase